MNFDIDKFVLAWNNATSVQNVADELGISYSMTHSRACRLKQKHGIKLKNFRKEKEKNAPVQRKNYLEEVEIGATRSTQIHGGMG